MKPYTEGEPMRFVTPVSFGMNNVRAIAFACFSAFAFTCLITQSPVAAANTWQDQEQPRPALSDETAAKVKQLVQVLKQSALDDNPEIRIIAVRALAGFVSYDGEIIDVLWDAANSPNAEVKEAGALAISYSGESTGKVIDALLSLLGDKQLSHETLLTIRARLVDMGADAVVPRAIEAIETGTPSTKQQAMFILVAFGDEGQVGLDVLLQTAMNEEEDVDIRAAALGASAEIMNAKVASERQLRVYEAQAIAEAEQLMQQLDADGDGKLPTDGSTPGFSSSMKNYDTDNDGFITMDELTTHFVRTYAAQARARSTRGRANTGRGGFEDATNSFGRGGRGRDPRDPTGRGRGG